MCVKPKHMLLSEKEGSLERRKERRDVSQRAQIPKEEQDTCRLAEFPPQQDTGTRGGKSPE